MSVRPIDQVSMVSKTQQTAANKQAEISKGENISYHRHLEREKNNLRSQQRVTDTKQTEDNIIKRDEEYKSAYYKEQEKKDSKQNSDEESDEYMEDIDEKVKEEYKGPKGHSLDIRI